MTVIRDFIPIDGFGLNMTMSISRFLRMGWNFIRDLRSILIITITGIVIRVLAIRSRQDSTSRRYDINSN